MKNKIVLLLIAGLLLVVVAACGTNAAPTPTQFPPTAAPTQAPPTIAPTQVPPTVAATDTSAAPAIARPSNPGGPGKAVDLTGVAASGKKIFEANCVVCHGQEGKGNVVNAGSSDGTVPALNPIDATLKSSDYKTYATNLDLFIEHGSTPAGASPMFLMPNWGDSGKLLPQQIADVIAYLISLNK